MVGSVANIDLLKALRSVTRRLRERSAGVAIIVALSTPLLLGFVGLAADASFWFQNQETLQSAADAGAIAAGKANATYGDTTTATAEPFALAAANNASHQQFNLTTATLTLTAGAPFVSNAGKTATPWTVTATIPRNVFFSAVLGAVSGTQSASATVAVLPAAPCDATTGVIQMTNNSKLIGKNCAITNNNAQTGVTCASNNGAIDAEGNGAIEGAGGVTTESACITTPNNGYAGTTNAYGTAGSGHATATPNAQGTADPLAGMNPNDVYTGSSSSPNMPWAPTPSTPGWETTPIVLNNVTNSTVTKDLNGAGTCSSAGTCTLNAGSISSLRNMGFNSLTLNQPVTNAVTGKTSASTYIDKGISGAANPLIMEAGTYYINGGMTLDSGANDTLLIGSSAADLSMTVNGNSQLASSSSTTIYSGPQGYFQFTSPSPESSSTCSIYSCSTGAFYISAGSSVNVGNPISSLSGIQSPATYYFDGGLTIGNAATTVYLNPGIYYIKDGDLYIEAGSKVVANDVTFVLEGTAAFYVSGSGSLTINAPQSTTSNPGSCVAPSAFPIAAYDAGWPYDGTNGQGICGIAIYQSRDDSATDDADGGGSFTINGSIYAPSATLNNISSGTLNITGYGTPAIQVKSITSSGGGTINLTQDSAEGTPLNANAVNTPLLIQ